MADKDGKKKKTDEEIEAEARAQMADSPVGAVDEVIVNPNTAAQGVSTSPDMKAMAEADYRAPTPLEAAAQYESARVKKNFAPELVPANPVMDVDMGMGAMDADVADTGATGPNAASTTTETVGRSNP